MSEWQPPRPDATPEAWHGPTFRIRMVGEDAREAHAQGLALCLNCGTKALPDAYDCDVCFSTALSRPDLPPSRWPMRVFLASAALTLGLATCALADDAPCAETAALPSDVQTVPDGGAVTFFIEEVKV